MANSFQADRSADRQVGHLTDDDLADVLDIERQGYSFPWSEAVFRDCFRSNYRLWGVRADDGCLLGYAVVAYMADEAHLLNLCVSTRDRRAGIGRQLLNHLVCKSVHDGMTKIILEVRASNHSAIQLYIAEGFLEIGFRPGYYPSGREREDARVFALELGQVTD